MILPLSREQAWNLLCQWTESESLRRHALAVEAAMRVQARAAQEDEDAWGQVGLLHDLDYERFPSLDGDGHPRHGMAELERLGYPAEFVRAVASHADFMGVRRESALERALYGVDELCGFVAACAYVRPQGIHGMTAKSVRKKLRQPSFAAAVDRDALVAAARELGVDFDVHVTHVIDALTPHAERLGLQGRDAGRQH